MTKLPQNTCLVIIAILLISNLFFVAHFLLREKPYPVVQETEISRNNNRTDNINCKREDESPQRKTSTTDKTSKPDENSASTSNATTKEAKKDIKFTLITKSPYATGEWKVYGKIIVPNDAKITKTEEEIVIKKDTFVLTLAGNDDMSDSVFKPYSVLPGYKKIGAIKLLTAEEDGYVFSELYRVAYQTDGNIFYTNNFEKTKKCEVGNYSETPPCAWPTISFSTKTFIWAKLDCGSEQPSQQCLDWGDSIVKTLEIKH